MTDKEKILAEIERLKKYSNTMGSNAINSNMRNFYDGNVDALKQVEDFINSLPEEPVSEDLEEAANDWDRKASFHPICMIMDGDTPIDTEESNITHGDSFKAVAQWQKEQFEKNRLKHCNSITNEQAELEQDFIDQHLDKYQRMPTFLDAIEYGMKWQKEQEEQYDLIQYWFEHIAQIADDRMTATGQRMTDSHALDEIKAIAKDSVYYIKNHLYD